MVKISDILNIMSDQSSVAKELVKAAWDFALKAHEGQKRLSGEPYISHPANVAFYLAEIGMGKETIAAGLLHDTLEDTPTTPEKIETLFGPEVLTLAEGVTRLGTLKYKGREEYAENLRRLFVATAQDVRTIIIKLADRLHNMRTLQYQDSERQERKALETLEVYAPIARRLGMSNLKKELEDISFSFLNPEGYREMVKLEEVKLHDDKKQVKAISKRIVEEISRGKIRVYAVVKTKGLYSLYKKIERKDGNMDLINDIFTISVIVPNINDCYRALGIIHGTWKPLPTEIKDFIAFPKPTGYQAIHTTIFREDGKALEIQISTEEMYLRSKYGVVFFFTPKSFHEKLNGRSKKITFFPGIRFRLHLFNLFSKDHDGITERMQPYKVPVWLRKMVNIQEKISKPDEFIKSLSDDFFQHRIFVFTANGNLIDLPIDSSPIDFAYTLGRKIGNHLESARVNHEEADFDTKLKNGDIVEVLTNKESCPHKSWLKYAKTSNAKQLISIYFQKVNKE